MTLHESKLWGVGLQNNFRVSSLTQPKKHNGVSQSSTNQLSTRGSGQTRITTTTKVPLAWR